MISKVVIDKLKKSNGKYQIKESNGKCDLLVFESGTWAAVMVGQTRNICEDAIIQASRDVILG